MGLVKSYKKFLSRNDPFDKAILEVVRDCKLKIKVVFLESAHS